MRKLIKAIAASIAISVNLFMLGCGSGVVVAPSISQVFPQTIAAGTQSQVIKVVGDHFANNAAILWNGQALPTTVVDANTLSGSVAGSNLATPRTVQLKVQNVQSGEQSEPALLTVVAATSTSSASQLTVSSSALAGATLNQAYSSTLTAAGGTPAYTWSVTSGQLPTGLSLSASTGSISGTPTAAGTFSFTATVADSGSPQQTQSIMTTITVAPSKLVIAPVQLSSGTVGTVYSAQLAASGGTAGYIWSITGGSLPSGLSLSASTGAISGKPTVSGTSSFTVTVADSGNPAQTSSIPASITISSSQLAITSSTPPSGTIGAPYSMTLQASGGTPSYSWAILSGSLPAGLNLASNGVISGTPTASGTSNLTITVTDSASPAQVTATSTSITIQTSQLTITSSALPSGTVGTAYSMPLQASGGTPPYTWSIQSGTLPAGLTLAATTGVISGTPTAPGTSQILAVVTDNGNPAQTQSAAIAITMSAAAAGTTWYVRPDGGTRYSSNVTTGQCDGKGDAPYPGSGVNQHCAFSDVRYLWEDGTYTYGTSFPGWGWVIAGGDTVIIRGSIATGVSYRVGANSQTQYCDSTGCWGITGSPSWSGAPAPPSGTVSQHTRILGENYGSCTSPSAKTQLHGGMATGVVLNLSGSSYVDVACLDITDFSACGRATQSVACDTTQDFAQNGIAFSNTTTNVTLTDIHIHGMASAGIIGPTGDGVVINRIDLIGNASSGWNADPGDGTTGVGSLLVQNFLIWGNGCAEQYPLVYPAANSISDCTDDASGGYGDGFGTATVTSPAPGWQVHFDQGVVAYNTQDGLDALHVNGPGSTMTDTRVLAYGNEGNQLKVGAGAVATIQNSVVVGNCEAMTTVASIPTFAPGFGSKLADPCRAGNTAVLLYVTPGDPATFQDNTIYEDGAIGLEVEYATSDQGPTNTLKYNNNIFVGFLNVGAGENATPIYSNSDLKMLTNPGASWTNNVTFGQRNNWSCPQAGESKAICGSPGLVDQTYHSSGYGDMTPSTGSAVVGAGIAVPGITTDYTGKTRSDPPSIGAYE